VADRSRPARRWAAARELYRALHAERFTALYRTRHRELTGETLPNQPEVPDLPEAVRNYPGTVEELLAEVERSLAQPAAS
jgi:hypothetical protein